MPEAVGSAPAGGDAAASSAPASPAAAGGDVSQASAGLGHAPETGGDATTGDQTAQGDPSAAAPSKFLFGGREWNDQKHAEDSFKAQLGRLPGVQRENETLKRQLAEAQATVEALQRVAVAPRTPGQGQRTPQGQDDGSASSFADRLVANKEIDFLASLISDDPQIREALGPGFAKAIYGMAQLWEQEMASRDSRIEQRFVAGDTRQHQERTVAQGFSAIRKLAANGFPELDPDNHDPAAEEAQQAFLSELQAFPPGEIARDPEFYFEAIANRVRRHFGTPVFAKPPGSSGSPSELAAAAAEAAGNAGSPTPLDGPGVPRPRPGGRETPQDRMRRENREVTAARTEFSPSGRPIFTRI